jgi:general secretion pathway protein J
VKTRRDAGFTLLELLLAIGLLSLITGSILGGLHLGKRVWETGRNYEALAEVEGEALAISQLLSRAFPSPTAGSNNNRIIAFRGGPTDCSFIALSEGETERAGLIATEIGPAVFSEHAHLGIWTKVFRTRSEFPPVRGEMRETQAVPDLANFELSYFGFVEPNRPPVWTNIWVDRDRLPQLVSVKIGANRFGRRLETSFVVALRQQ